MITFMLNRNLRKLLSLGYHAIRVTFADAVLCAACGALYGIVFGGFGAQARNELTLSGVFSIGGRSAMKSIEQLAKGQVELAPSVGEKAGLDGCLSILNC